MPAPLDLAERMDGEAARAIEPILVGGALERASIRGKALRPLRRCTWLIPKSAAGKRLTVVVSSRKYVLLVRRA